MDRQQRLAALLAERIASAGADVIDAAGAGSGPVSATQQSMWIVAKLADGAAALRPTAVRVRGAVGPDGIAWAWSTVMARHQVLRSTFPAGPDGLPTQVVHPVPALELGLDDLSALPEEAREAEVRRIARSVCGRGFDVEREIPVAARLIRLAADDHVLVLALSHLAFDGWSEQLLHRELAALCTAWVRGERADPLPAPPIQYLDYARWERRARSEELMERQIDHWRSVLDDVPELTLPGPGRGGAGHGPVVVEVGAGAVARLADLAHTTEATTFMVLLAALFTAIADATGDDDIVVGIPTAGRSRPETEDCIGCFINTVLVRVKPREAGDFAALVRTVRAGVLSALEHQHVPYSRVVAAVRPWGRGGHLPLYRVHFQLRDFPVAPVDASEVDVSSYEFEANASGHALAVRATPRGDRMEVSIGFDPELVSREFVEHLAGRLIATLGEGDGAPENVAAVAAVFAEVLGLPEAGPDTDFFDAGGHSLLAIRLAAALRARVGIDLPINDLFVHRTVGDVARLAGSSSPVPPRLDELLEEIRSLGAQEAADLLGMLGEAQA